MATMTLTEAAVGEVELPNEQGQNYRGVLLNHPAKPWIEYNLRYTMSFSSKKFLVRPATHIADDQPTIAFQGARKQRDTTTFFTKLRNCTLIAKELDAKIGSNVFGQFGPMGFGSNAIVPAKGVIMERLALQAAASAASSSSAAPMLLARAAPTTPGRQPSQGSGLRAGLLQRSGSVEDIDSQSVLGVWKVLFLSRW